MLPLQDDVQARSFPIANWMLIAANTFIFFYQATLGPQQLEAFVAALGVVPARLLAMPDLTQVLTLFTSMFLHGGWLHLFSNMLALYIFGDNVEDRMGSARYLAFYLICGLAAALTHVAFNPNSQVPTIGASGAISGVLGAYFILFPMARVLTLIPIFFLPWFVEIPAVVYLGLWFVSQLFSGALSIASGATEFGGVAWWAHAGGFVAGVVLIWPLTRQRSTRRQYVDEYRPW